MDERLEDAVRVDEEAIASEVVRLRGLLTLAPYALYLLDRQGVVVAANERGAEVFGLTVAELVGTRLGAHYPDGLRDSRRERGLEVFRTGRAVTFEDCFEGRWSLATIRPLTDGQGEVTHVAIYGADITEQKAVQESLRQSQALYRLVADNVADVVWVLDPRTRRLKYVSPSVERLVGYTVDEMAELVVEELFPEESRPAITALVRDRCAALEAGEPATAGRLREMEQVRKDGSRIWVEISTACVRNASGEIEIIGSSRDITARKRLEAQLLQAQKMEAIGTLAGGIAHDFNNLLMAIQGNASLLLAELAEYDPRRNRLEAIEECVRSGADLTRQLLGFARGGAYQVVPTDPNDLVERTARLFGRSRKQIVLHLRLSADVWAVEVDRSQVEQALLNLFVNAWHAMPYGGDLLIETRNETMDQSRATEHEALPGRYVRISVTDTGVGMDAATVGRVFDPFFTTREMGRGTGLGLASVYGIVRSHKGFVTASSELGKGSTFEVFLPATERRPVAIVAPTEQVELGAGRVLLVDDEATVRAAAAGMLRKLGYEVLVAASGEEALDRFEREGAGIGLVVLDIVMPGLGGAEVFDRLRALDPAVRVLLASGYSLDSEARALLDRGCRAFIQKPWSLAELSQKVREALEG